MTLDVPLSAEIEILREKCRNDTATPEELRAMIERLRSGRISAAASGKKRTAAVKFDAAGALDDL